MKWPARRATGGCDEGGSSGPCVVGPHKMGPVDPMSVDCRMRASRSSARLPIRKNDLAYARIGELAYVPPRSNPVQTGPCIMPWASRRSGLNHAELAYSNVPYAGCAVSQSARPVGAHGMRPGLDGEFRHRPPAAATQEPRVAAETVQPAQTQAPFSHWKNLPEPVPPHGPAQIRPQAPQLPSSMVRSVSHPFAGFPSQLPKPASQTMAH